jgi:hypothetical protein
MAEQMDDRVGQGKDNRESERRAWQDVAAQSLMSGSWPDEVLARIPSTSVLSPGHSCAQLTAGAPGRFNQPGENRPAPIAATDRVDWLSRSIYEHEKKQWDAAESLVTFVGGSLAINRILSKMPRTTAAQRLLRDQTIASASTAVLAASVTEYAFDRLLTPNDQKMEATVCADWLIGTGIAMTALPFRTKFASMMAIHAAGRAVDHFRQPKQPF